MCKTTFYNAKVKEVQNDTMVFSTEIIEYKPTNINDNLVQECLVFVIT